MAYTTPPIGRLANPEFNPKLPNQFQFLDSVGKKRRKLNVIAWIVSRRYRLKYLDENSCFRVGRPVRGRILPRTGRAN
jgi:hypothetical protein